MKVFSSQEQQSSAVFHGNIAHISVHTFLQKTPLFEGYCTYHEWQLLFVGISVHIIFHGDHHFQQAIARSCDSPPQTRFADIV